MANYLGIPEEAVPPPLRRFVSQVTMGNPLYIRETLDQLSEENVLKVKPGTSATLIGALEKIDISAWNHTAMVGGTVCNIESLDPIEMAALKMLHRQGASPEGEPSECRQRQQLRGHRVLFHAKCPDPNGWRLHGARGAEKVSEAKCFDRQSPKAGSAGANDRAGCQEVGAAHPLVLRASTQTNVALGSSRLGRGMAGAKLPRRSSLRGLFRCHASFL
eukprot:s1620_g4.t1